MPFFRAAHLNTARIAFTRLLAPSGKASFRSRKTSISFAVILESGMSRKNRVEPGAIGSSKVASKNSPTHALRAVIKAQVVRTFGKVLRAKPTPCAGVIPFNLVVGPSPLAVSYSAINSGVHGVPRSRTLGWPLAR